ncbi:MAG: hypothetical protein IKN45_08795 [Lachnospiraceae bacterium]|nr:hypothetical protein [Lachnospiraceae bacterium]
MPFIAGSVMVISAASIMPYVIIKTIPILMGMINIAVYIQFMFFNQFIGQMNGDVYRWKDHVLHTVLNIFVWILIIGLGLFLGFIKKKEKIIFAINGIIGVLLVVSLIFAFIKAPGDVISRKQFYLSGEEQFTIGKDKNAVLLIADAVDNKYIKQILEEEPGFMDDFNDFTIYTNTCSVYDMTNTSIPQMLYGYTQKADSENAVSFLKRFTNQGYRNLFFYYEKASEMNEDPKPYISNYVFTKVTESILDVNYKMIRDGFVRMSLYRLCPCILKTIFGRMDINFDYCILYNGGKDELVVDNQDFKNKLNLSYNELSDRCFIYQHITGIHFPCDDYYQGTKESLDIFKEYLRQMKELGVYDNSLIIIASDHGVHDDVEGIPFATASTPMLFIKKPMEKHNEFILSGKPVYYRDFQATLLKYAGLYEDQFPAEEFGKTIDDYDEHEERMRVWFDTGFNNQKIRKYEYTGDTEELERVVREGIYEEVDSLEYGYEDIQQ